MRIHHRVYLTFYFTPSCFNFAWACILLARRVSFPKKIEKAKYVESRANGHYRKTGNRVTMWEFKLSSSLQKLRQSFFPFCDSRIASLKVRRHAPRSIGLFPAGNHLHFCLLSAILIANEYSN